MSDQQAPPQEQQQQQQQLQQEQPPAGGAGQQFQQPPPQQGQAGAPAIGVYQVPVSYYALWQQQIAAANQAHGAHVPPAAVLAQAAGIAPGQGTNIADALLIMGKNQEKMMQYLFSQVQNDAAAKADKEDDEVQQPHFRAMRMAVKALKVALQNEDKTKAIEDAFAAITGILAYAKSLDEGTSTESARNDFKGSLKRKNVSAEKIDEIAACLKPDEFVPKRARNTPIGGGGGAGGAGKATGIYPACTTCGKANHASADCYTADPSRAPPSKRAYYQQQHAAKFGAAAAAQFAQPYMAQAAAPAYAQAPSAPAFAATASSAPAFIPMPTAASAAGGPASLNDLMAGMQALSKSLTAIGAPVVPWLAAPHIPVPHAAQQVQQLSKKCSVCGKGNHTEATCWTKNPQMMPAHMRKTNPCMPVSVSVAVPVSESLSHIARDELMMSIRGDGAGPIDDANPVVEKKEKAMHVDASPPSPMSLSLPRSLSHRTPLSEARPSLVEAVAVSSSQSLPLAPHAVDHSRTPISQSPHAFGSAPVASERVAVHSAVSETLSAVHGSLHAREAESVVSARDAIENEKGCSATDKPETFVEGEWQAELPPAAEMKAVHITERTRHTSLKELLANAKGKKVFDGSGWTCLFCSKIGHTSESCASRPTIPEDDERSEFVDRLIASPEIDVIKEYKGLTWSEAKAKVETLGARLNQGNPWADAKEQRLQLSRQLGYWKAIGCSSVILSWIAYGLDMRFVREPMPIEFRNHKASAAAKPRISLTESWERS